MMTFYPLKKSDISPCVCALGTFDGVHIGHRALLARTAQSAGERKLAFAVIVILRPGECISTLEERLSVIRSEGADFAFVFALSDIKNMSCEDFVCLIKKECMTRYCVCGFNFRFGAGASGDAQKLDRLIGADIMPPFMNGGDAVSSTQIRGLIKNGDMKRAALLLGAPYTLHGNVVHGRGVGRTLGSPTANIILSEETLMPARGVYASDIIIDDKKIRAVTNIGVRPTFDNGDTVCESYIIGFSGDIYGKSVSLSLLHRIRDEIKFDTPEALAEQIKNDVREALAEET